MHLYIIKAITRYLGIQDDEPGAAALQCCAAAGAEMEARGEPWTFGEVLEAFALRRKRNVIDLSAEVAALCLRHELPPKSLVVRFLAIEAERLEAETAEFTQGLEVRPLDAAENVRLLCAIAKCARGRKE